MNFGAVNASFAGITQTLHPRDRIEKVIAPRPSAKSAGDITVMNEQEIIAELLRMTQDDDRDQDDENRSPFFDKNRAQTEELGEILWKIGGLALMQKALSQMPKYDQHELDCIWDGIGDWHW